jgi:hypothetical protein
MNRFQNTPSPLHRGNPRITVSPDDINCALRRRGSVSNLSLACMVWDISVDGAKVWTDFPLKKNEEWFMDLTIPFEGELFFTVIWSDADKETGQGFVTGLRASEESQEIMEKLCKSLQLGHR